MKSVLLVSIAFSPNIGGIETHFDDLVSELSKKTKVYVLTYKPITTPVSAPVYEKRGNTFIYRIPWFNGFFYKLVKHPIIEFAMLFPGLFIVFPLLLLFKSKEIEVIHSHGLVAGAVSAVWGRVFNKRVVATTHSIYNFPDHGLYRNFSKLIFNNSNTVLTLSEQSKKEIQKLGVTVPVYTFRYWINLDKFKPNPKAKQELSWTGFNVLFVGRLIEEKGIRILTRAALTWDKRVQLHIVGVGPLEEELKKVSLKTKNIEFVGPVDNSKLPEYYAASDLLVVPSTHEEGFGRVILESLACGTPVIGANRGAIPEAMNDNVGELIEINPNNITKTVEKYHKNTRLLNEKSRNAVKFAKRKYSKRNLSGILRAYEK